MVGKLEGKVALVTGGGSGIGRASSLLFACEGAKVVVADVATDGGEETVEMIRKSGGEATFIKTDVSQSSQVELLIARTIDIYERLDCAHNNAGLLLPEPLTHELTEEHWDRVMSVNLKGVWLCMKYEIPHMLKLGSGAIVNTASVGGLIGTRHLAAYTTSKHGVIGVTKSAALEYAKMGIRINAVCPATIVTPPVERDIRANPKNHDRFVSSQPIGRLGQPKEVAEAVLWLCSDAASFVTGSCLTVDGGFTAQ